MFNCSHGMADARPDDHGIMEEKVAVVEALRNMKTLGIIGGALRIHGKIQAFL